MILALDISSASIGIAFEADGSIETLLIVGAHEAGDESITSTLKQIAQEVAS